MTSSDQRVDGRTSWAFQTPGRQAAWLCIATWLAAHAPCATSAETIAPAQATTSPVENAAEAESASSPAGDSPPPASAAGPSGAIARAIAGAIERALPETYEKHDDWGATKTIAVGLKASGKGLNFDIKRRRKEVPHGLWKHYKIQRRQGGPSPSVQLENLQVTSEGKASFRLTVDLDFDYWARAKLYQYGVHLMALEVVGSCKATLRMDGEVGLRFMPVEGSPGVAIDPQATDAQLTIHEWRVDRVSNLHGPLVEELGSGVRRLIEREMNGPTLTAKLNRAIDKKRDRLQVPLTLPSWGGKP